MDDPAFTTWKYNGVQFLAVPTLSGTNVNVLDEKRNWYGAWSSVENFRDHQRREKEIARPLSGCKAVAAVQTYEVKPT